MLLTVVRCQRQRLWFSIRYIPGLILLATQDGKTKMKHDNVRCEAESSKKQETHRWWRLTKKKGLRDNYQPCCIVWYQLVR